MNIYFEGNASLAMQGAKTASVIISNDCYLGLNITFLGGFTIDGQCIVGACKFVNKNLELGYFYARVSAQKIKNLNG